MTLSYIKKISSPVSTEGLCSPDKPGAQVPKQAWGAGQRLDSLRGSQSPHPSVLLTWPTEGCVSLGF